MVAGQHSEDQVIDRALVLVDEHGPIAVDDVMAQSGADELGIDPDDLIDELVDGYGIWWIADRLLRPGQVLAGRRFTHRLTAEEMEGGFLRPNPDLSPLSLDESKSFRTPIGEFQFEMRGDSLVYSGPVACFSSYSPGDVVGARWQEPGVLELERVEDAGAGDAEVAALRAAFSATARPRGTSTLFDVFVEACVGDASLFADAVPLVDLLERSGLDARGDELAEAGFDWEAEFRRRNDAWVRDLAEPHDRRLDSARHLAALELTSVLSAARKPERVGECVAALRDPAATAAYLEVKLGRRAHVVVALTEIMEVVERASAPQLPAGAHLLRARLAEVAGDAPEHQRQVDEALRVDPTFWPALEDRAWIRCDRGDIRAAAADLELVVDDDNPRLLLLDRYSAPGPQTTGRNDQCPCGSGRKHKACCGRTNGYHLVDRAPLLFEKVMWFASRPAQRDDVVEMIEESLDEYGQELDLRTFPEEVLVQFPAILHLAVFGCGLLRRYRDERGVLLPADERDLLDGWVDRDLRALRVDAVLPDHLQATDLETGESLELAIHAIDDSVVTGGVIAAAPLPDGRSESLLAWLALSDEAASELRRTGSYAGLLAELVRERLEHVRLTILALQATADERLAWVFPEMDTDEIDDATIAELVARQHPEMVAAIDAGRATVPVAGGHEVDPTLHLAIHETVVSQMVGDDPPEVWHTAIRLSNLDYDRHEILHMLGSTVSTQWFAMLADEAEYDRDRQIEELAALPDTWEAARFVHSGPDGGRRHSGRHRRR